MATVLTITQSGSNDTVVDVEPGDTITLELAENQVQQSTLAASAVGLVALGQVLGVTFAIAGAS